MAVNPGTEAHSTRTGLLQFVGTAPNPGDEEQVWGPNQGGGDPAGPVKVADERMARRLPFALCALPRLEELCVDFDGSEYTFTGAPEKVR